MLRNAVYQNHKTRQGAALGTTGMGAAVGFAFAPLLTGILSGQLGFGWQQIALLFGVCGAAVGIVAWFFSRAGWPCGSTR